MTEEVMTISKEMLERHNLAQKAAQAVTASLDGLTIVEAVGVLELVKQGMLKYAEQDYDLDVGGVH
jgi:hypothetical protein